MSFVLEETPCNSLSLMLVPVLYRDYEYGLTVKAEHRHAKRVGCFVASVQLLFLSLLDIEFSVMGNEVSQQSYTKSRFIAKCLLSICLQTSSNQRL